MAEDPSEFTRQNAQRAMEAASFGMDWYRELTEQNLVQSKIAAEGLLNILREMVNDFGNQSSAMCRHSMSLAHEMILNAFEVGQKAVRAKEPHEVLQLQSELVSRQAQAIAEETKQLGHMILKRAKTAADATVAKGADVIREQAKAA